MGGDPPGGSTTTSSTAQTDDDFIQRVLDMYGSDVNRIVVDSNTGLKRVKQYLTNWSGVKHRRDC